MPQLPATPLDTATPVTATIALQTARLPALTLALALFLPAVGMAGTAFADQSQSATTLTLPQSLTAATQTTDTAPSAQQMSAEQARAFLARYPGTWEGNSTVQSIDGQFRTVIGVRIDYQNDPQKPDEISGRAVFAIGEHTIFATSRTYYSKGRLYCVIERNGLEEMFIGRINAEGTSVTWRSQDKPNALKSYSKETFTPASGGEPDQLITEGYEDYTSQDAILTQKTILNRIAPATTAPVSAN